MKKDLKDMTLEEMWQLFPIILCEHRAEYKIWYQEESARVLACVGNKVVRMNHMGSTAVEGLTAKPTVDILLEIDSASDLPKIRATLEADKWILMNEQHSPFMKQAYCKGYTPDGFAERVFHLHMRYPGDWDELYFRDYLRIHAEAREAYAALKLQLWKQFEHDRDGYTEAKSAMIQEMTHRARAEFPDRYVL